MPAMRMLIAATMAFFTMLVGTAGATPPITQAVNCGMGPVTTVSGKGIWATLQASWADTKYKPVAYTVTFPDGTTRSFASKGHGNASTRVCTFTSDDVSGTVTVVDRD
jgi:hypothetical protein